MSYAVKSASSRSSQGYFAPYRQVVVKTFENRLKDTQVSDRINNQKQLVFFTFVPVATPVKWRTCNLRRGCSERFLAIVQSPDARSNSFPSMHTSVATLTACHLCSWAGPWVFLFPVLIALSCLYTKPSSIMALMCPQARRWAYLYLECSK